VVRVTPRSKGQKAPFGVNVVGYVTGILGLGVATRHSISMLERAGVRVAATDMGPWLGYPALDATHAVLRPAALQSTPYVLTLFHANPSTVARVLRVQPRLSRFDRLNAIVPFWELEVLPPEWVPVLEAMDMILTPTEFIRSAIEKALPDALCLDYPQVVDVNLADAGPDRDRWGMPGGATVFVTSFDLASSIERKNPRAVVEAFQQAFPDRSDVQLFLKANNAGAVRDDTGLWTGLLELVSRDHRMHVITEVLPYDDVISLYASADCFISLHRSEGLGLGMMEAMLLGKPVIATGWSGNLDFMTADNSRLVEFELVPVVTDSSHYAGYGARGAVWADPSVSSAADHMREVTADAEAARALGKRAQQDLLERRARLERGDVVDRLRELSQPNSPVWLHHLERRQRLRELARGAELAAMVRHLRFVTTPIHPAARPVYRQIRRLGRALSPSPITVHTNPKKPR